MPTPKPAHLDDVTRLLKDIKREVEKRNLSQEIYYLLVNVIGYQYVTTLLRPPIPPRFRRFQDVLRLHSTELSTFAENSRISDLGTALNTVGKERNSLVLSLITAASKESPRMPELIRNKLLFTGYTRLRASNTNVDSVLEIARMLDRMEEDQHKDKYRTRSENLSWISRRFKRGVAATRGALLRKLAKLETDVKSLNPESDITAVRRMMDRLYTLQKNRLQYREAFEESRTATESSPILSKAAQDYDKRLNALLSQAKTHLQNQMQKLKISVKESAVPTSAEPSLGKKIEDLTEQNIEIAKLRSQLKVARMQRDRTRVGRELMQKVDEAARYGRKSSTAGESSDRPWTTYREKIERVLENGTIDPSTRTRYENYLHQLETGETPPLPGFYHATTLDSFISMFQEEKITPSDEKKQRPGVWTSTSPEVSTNATKDDYQRNFVCGVAFSQDFQWQQMGHGKGVGPSSSPLGYRAEFVDAIDGTAGTKPVPRRVWAAFQGDIPLIVDGKLNPRISYIFFDTEKNHQAFKKALGTAEYQQLFTDNDPHIVIGLDKVIQESKTLQGVLESEMESDLQIPEAIGLSRWNT